jgi:hypothetical protein
MTVKPQIDESAVTYIGKFRGSDKGLEGLKSLVTPFGAEAQQGSSQRSFFISSPAPLDSEHRIALQNEGFVITGNV